MQVGAVGRLHITRVLRAGDVTHDLGRIGDVVRLTTGKLAVVDRERKVLSAAGAVGSDSGLGDGAVNRARGVVARVLVTDPRVQGNGAGDVLLVCQRVCKLKPRGGGGVPAGDGQRDAVGNRLAHRHGLSLLPGGVHVRTVGTAHALVDGGAVLALHGHLDRRLARGLVHAAGKNGRGVAVHLHERGERLVDPGLVARGLDGDQVIAGLERKRGLRAGNGGLSGRRQSVRRRAVKVGCQETRKIATRKTGKVGFFALARGGRGVPKIGIEARLAVRRRRVELIGVIVGAIAHKLEHLHGLAVCKTCELEVLGICRSVGVRRRPHSEHGRHHGYRACREQRDLSCKGTHIAPLPRPPHAVALTAR